MGKGRTLIAAAIVAALLTATVSPSPAEAAPEEEVLVVGDSLAELTSPYLARYLPGVALTINVGGGYNSYQIFDLFQESYSPSHSVIVFDAGTNDNPAYPEILAGNLQGVVETIGDRCMVVPTIHGFTVDGIGNQGKNRVVAEFAASRPGTQTPDWAREVAAHPELMQSDNLHPTPAGADLRAQLIAQGVMGCLHYLSTPAGASGVASRPEARPELAGVDAFADRQAEAMGAIAARAGPGLAGSLLVRGQVLEGLTAIALLELAAGSVDA